MAARLTDDELDALLERFSPGRHPKVAAALAELKDFRAGAWRPMRDWTPEAAAVAEFEQHLRDRGHR